MKFETQQTCIARGFLHLRDLLAGTRLDGAQEHCDHTLELVEVIPARDCRASSLHRWAR
jgi:hypothetical protein